MQQQQKKSPIQSISDSVFPCLSGVIQFFKTSKRTLLHSLMARWALLFFTLVTPTCSAKAAISLHLWGLSRLQMIQKSPAPTFKQGVCPSNYIVMIWHRVRAGRGLEVTEGWVQITSFYLLHEPGPVIFLEAELPLL